MAEELLKAYGTKIKKLSLQPSYGGRYEVSLNDKLIFSKIKKGRFPETIEIIDIINSQ